MARLTALLVLASCSPGLQYIPAEAVSDPWWRDVTPPGTVQAPLPTTRENAVTIAVLPAKVDVPEDFALPELFDDYVLTAVQNAGEFRVIGRTDIDAMLGLERQRELLGCDDAVCMADIGGALGVDFMVTLAVARVEDEWVVTTKLIDIRAARVEARTSDFVPGGVSELMAGLPALLAELFAGRAL